LSSRISFQFDVANACWSQRSTGFKDSKRSKVSRAFTKLK
jgi:hypothetical protein